MSKDKCIDFATWYSGMEKKKVEAAYDRYEREVLNKSNEFTGSNVNTDIEKSKIQNSHD